MGWWRFPQVMRLFKKKGGGKEKQKQILKTRLLHTFSNVVSTSRKQKFRPIILHCLIGTYIFLIKVFKSKVCFLKKAHTNIRIFPTIPLESSLENPNHASLLLCIPSEVA